MIVVTGHYGQLGNRLIVFANLLAAAREHGLRIANPAFYEYAPLFEGTRRDPLCQHLIHTAFDRLRPLARKLRHRTGCLPPGVRTLEIGWDRPCDLDSPEFVALARRPGLLLIRGWRFRAPRSFERHADAIRTFFTPAEPHRRRVADLIARARVGADVLVGVHVRQGDYARFLGGRLHFTTPQYAHLMRATQALFDGRVRFLLCSNRPQPAATFADLDVTFGAGAPIEDLYSLAACDSLLAPPSTFSIWASFYGQTPLWMITHPAHLPARHNFIAVKDFRRAPEEYLPFATPAAPHPVATGV